jgi:ferredoxin-NADP reductase/ferredoxin
MPASSSPRILCDGTEIEVRDGERLLDSLLRAGARVASSCRAGLCQSCLVKATRGSPPAAAQVGLKDTLRAQGFFLACLAQPREDLELTLRATETLAVPAFVARVDQLSANTLRVVLQPSAPFPYRAGQYLTLVRADGLARAYSIASLPEADGGSLELHVRVQPKGQMSGWLQSPDAVGAQVHLRGPAGSCFYVEGNATQPLVLAGTGTGLAPLLGVLRDALRAGHTGPIALWHGARRMADFYLVEELKRLAARHPPFVYRRVVLEGATGQGGQEGDDGLIEGQLGDSLLAEQSAFVGQRVFLCGDPGLVADLKRRVFLAGAALKDIHADAFVMAASSG